MRVEDPETGRLFDSVDAAADYYCRTPPSRQCDGCPIDKIKQQCNKSCTWVCANRPDEVIDAIGYVFVFEEFDDAGFDFLIGGEKDGS